MNRRAMKIAFVGLAMLALAFVVATTVAVSRQRAADDRAAHGMFDGIAALQRQIAADNQALTARFGQVDVGRYMTPAMLVSADDLRAGRAELARYRALLAERDALMRDAAARAHALLTALPEGQTRSLALRGEAQTAARHRAVRDELSRSEAADSDAIQALFDWADANHAVLEVRNATLVVHGGRQLAELRARPGWRS